MTEHTNTALAPRKRARKIVAGTAVLVVGGGAAFAYWSATGTGTGGASNAADSQGVTVNQTSVITGLAPGATPQPLAGTFDNPNSAAVALTTVSGEVTSTSVPECLVEWYEVAGTGTVTGGSVPVGDAVGSWAGLTVQLVNDIATNQDACKGATLTISYTAS